MRPRRPGAAPSRAATLGLLTLACAAAASSGLLRTFHDAAPRWPAAEGPFASALFAITLALAALHWVHRRRRSDLFERRLPGTGLTAAQITPLLLFLFGEKWITTELLAPLYDWIDRRVEDVTLADAAYRAGTAIGLLVAIVMLTPALRQMFPRLIRFVSRARVRAALRLALLAGAGTLGLVLALTVALRGRWPGWPPALLAVGGAQIVRSTIEELFFRGLLQTALMRLALQAGLADRPPARLLVVLTVSASFALEHLDPTLSTRLALGALLYAFGMSIILGILYEGSRSLYLVMIAHAVINLLLVGAIPAPVTRTGLPVLTPKLTGLTFLFVLYLALWAGQQLRRVRAAAGPDGA